MKAMTVRELREKLNNLLPFTEEKDDCPVQVYHDGVFYNIDAVGLQAETPDPIILGIKPE